MGQVIKAGYICRGCGVDRAIEVRERAATEGIENYVYHLARMAGEDHDRTSPECREGKVDLKLPVTASGIGFAGAELTEEEKRAMAEQCRRRKGE